MGERTVVYRDLVGRSEGKRPLGRLKCRWDDIKLDLQEEECGGVDWIHLAEERDR